MSWLQVLPRIACFTALCDFWSFAVVETKLHLVKPTTADGSSTARYVTNCFLLVRFQCLSKSTWLPGSCSYCRVVGCWSTAAAGCLLAVSGGAASRLVSLIDSSGCSSETHVIKTHQTSPHQTANNKHAAISVCCEYHQCDLYEFET